MGIGTEVRIVETTAPAGYRLAAPVETKISKDNLTTVQNADGSTLSVLKVDVPHEKTEMTFDLQEEGTNTSLNGGHLQVIDSAGNVVDEWDTNGSAHTTKGLVEDADYTLRETTVPSGYTGAADLSLKGKDNGSMVMYNAKAASSGSSGTTTTKTGSSAKTGVDGSVAGILMALALMAAAGGCGFAAWRKKQQ